MFQHKQINYKLGLSTVEYIFCTLLITKNPENKKLIFRLQRKHIKLISSSTKMFY